MEMTVAGPTLICMHLMTGRKSSRKQCHQTHSCRYIISGQC